MTRPYDLLETVAKHTTRDCFRHCISLRDESYVLNRNLFFFGAVLFFLMHSLVITDFYRLLWSAATGNCSEVHATVVKVYHGKSYVYLTLEADDQTKFKITTRYISASPGSEFTALKSGNIYMLKDWGTVADCFWYTPLIPLCASAVFFLIFKMYRKKCLLVKRLKKENRYLTVHPTGKYDSRMVTKGKGSPYTLSNLYFRLDLNGDRTFIFVSSETKRDPEQMLSRSDIEYRIYFADPIHPDSSEIFLDEVIPGK